MRAGGGSGPSLPPASLVVGAFGLGLLVGLGAPHLLDYLAPVTYGVGAWAYATHPRCRRLLDR